MRLKQTTAVSIIEYIVLVMLILGALYTMNSRLLGGISAKYKSMGDIFGFGRQFDAKRTMSCKQDVLVDYNTGSPLFSTGTDGRNEPKLGPWYDENCYTTRVQREPSMSTDSTGAVSFDIVKGGCPQCYPHDPQCFKCEDDIKRSCESPYCAAN